jgi:hypothetical protein
MIYRNALFALNTSLLVGLVCLPKTILADELKGWSRTNAEEIRLDGEITSKTVSEFQTVAEGGFKRVVLNSPGGREYAAMRIAQDPRYGDADIIISKQCSSACAYFLALLGRSLTVSCESIIGFHGTNLPRHNFTSGYGLNILRKSDKDFNDSTIRQWYSNSNNEFRALFKERGVDIRILYYKNSKYLKNHYKFSFNTETGDVNWSISQNGIWMPSLTQLKAYGLKNLDYCAPANDEEFRARVERFSKHPEELRNYIFHVGP